MSLDAEMSLVLRDPFTIPEGVHDDFDALPMVSLNLSVVRTNQEYATDDEADEPEVHQPSLRLRRSAIPQIVWDRHKAIIKDLYIRKGLDLNQVIVTMKEKHRFDASDKMYKRQLRNWNFRKYYTQEQKKDFIHSVTQEEVDSTSTTISDSSGRPLKLHRLSRPVQRKGTGLSLVDHQTYKTLRSKRLLATQTATIHRVQLQMSEESQNIERLLKYAQTYYSWYLTQKSVRLECYLTRQLADLMILLQVATHLLPANSTRAFALLNKCCSDFSKILGEQPFHLLRELMAIFAGIQRRWVQHWQVRRILLEYLSSCVKTHLGAAHPIRWFLLLLMEVRQDQFRPLGCRMAELLSHTGMTDMTDNETRARIQLSAVDVFSRTGQHDMAWTLCQRLWEALQPLSSPPTNSQIECSQMAASVSLGRQDYATAEAFSTQQLQWSVAATGKQNGHYVGIFACYRMALLCKETGRASESEEFYRMALEGALQDGKSLENILFFLEELESFLEDHGKTEELAQLRRQYGYIWAEVDKWELRPGADFGEGLD